MKKFNVGDQVKVEYQGSWDGEIVEVIGKGYYRVQIGSEEVTVHNSMMKKAF